jgi:fucose 4-O-acetylase-like acetyltransferase
MAFDIARGAAIILVVFAHTQRGLVAANVMNGSPGYLLSDYIIYTFHMPFFFVLSGYFFRGPVTSEPQAWWWVRSRAIVYPYFLWSIIQGTIAYAVSGSGATNGVTSFSRLFEILWDPISPYWFLYALFFSNVLAMLMIRLGAGLMMGIAFIFLVSAFFLTPDVIQDISYGFFYFSIGIFIREKGLLRYLPVSGRSVVLLLVGFLAVAISSLLTGVPERMPIIAAFLGIATLVSTCFYLGQHFSHAALARILALIGQCSMGIFVMHIIIVSSCRFAFVRLLHIEEPALILTVATIMGVLIPTAVQIFVLRLNIQDYVGLPSSSKAIWRKQPVREV